MAIKDDLKSGVKLATDAATDVVQALVEKSRLRANANRIKQVIKSDTDLRNQAYIELGRYFYENLREHAGDEEEALCVVVDKTSHRIRKATQKYIDTISLLDDTKLSGESAQMLKAAVADKATKVKEKAKETTDKAKAKVSDFSDKAKLKAQDIAMKTKETAAHISYKAKDKVESINPFADDEDIEEFIFDDEIEMEEPDKFVMTEDDEDLDDELKAEVEDAPVVEIDCDEESPEEFEF